MSLIRHSFHIATKQIVYFLIIIATLLTLSVGAVYWLSEAVEQRQDEIATWVGTKLGYPVEIGAAGLHWMGVLPKLQVNAVTVFGQDHISELFSLKQLYFGIDLLASLQQGAPVLKDIAISGLHLSVVRDELGTLRLQGLDEEQKSSVDVTDLLSWAQLVNSIHLQAITVDYTDQQYISLTGDYKLTDATVTHNEQRWTTTANIHFPPTLGNSIQLDAQWVQDESDWHNSAWKWQAKLNDIKLEPLSEQLVWQDVGIDQGLINANLSGHGVGNEITAIKSELKLVHGELVSRQLGLVYTPVVIEQLSGRFDWQSKQQSWQLTAHDLQIQMNGDTWLKTALSLSEESDGVWQVSADYLRLSDITAIALLTEKSPEIIRQQKPAGDVEQFNLHYSIENGLSTIAFKLRDGALLPWKDYAGVTGLTAAMKWENDRVSLHLDSHQLTLYPETWLEDAVFFDSVSGRIGLQQNEQSWVIQSDAFRVWNDELTLQLDGSVEYTNNGKTVTDLKLTLEEVVVDKWKSYFPQRVLSDGLKAWFANAFQAGKIIDGEIELQGDLSAFPYQDSPGKGRFNMLLTVEDVHLHYAPGWPDLVGVNGTVTGTGNDLIIKSQHGNVAGFDFADVTTTITRLTQSKPILRVEGDVKGTTVKALQFLQNSPLRQRFGGVAKQVEASGKSNIHLNLMVPLSNTNATEVAGHVSFVDSQLYTNEFPDLVLSQINGLLQFSHQSVSANTIQASFLSAPVNIDVTPDGGRTIVLAYGQIDTEQIKSRWPNKLINSISGNTAYQMVMPVSEKALGDFSIDVSVHSNLRGIEIDLPQPFAKNRDEEKSFQTEFEHIDDGIVYSAQYSDLLNAIVMLDEELLRGEIHFGVGKAKLPDQGLQVSGKLASIAIDDWLQWNERQANVSSRAAINIDDISITIGKLTGFNQQLTGLKLSAQRDAQGWRTDINSDQTTGFVYLPTDFNSPAVLKVNLNKVDFSVPEGDTTNTENNSDSPSILWPGMEIDIAALTINGMALGECHVRAHRETNTWSLDSATLTSDIFTASIPVGLWHKSPAGERSHFELKADSNDLAALLTNFDYQAGISAESVAASAHFSWSGTPLNVSTANINGTLSFDVGKGKLEDIEPGAAGRIFGLLSVAAIPRRLALDFSDLFSKGFSFDSITGKFDLAKGQAVTDSMILTGASAKVEMSGAIDLINKQYDQKVKVTPDVSSTLPIAGAVAGGPVGLGVGTAILLVDKLVDKIFDKNIVNLISYNYKLIGSWDDPQLNPVKPATQ